MASTSVPCPKTSFISRIGSNVSNPPPRPSASFPSRGFQWPNKKQSALTTVKAQLNEAIVKDSSNSVPVLDSNSKIASPEVKDEPVKKNVPVAATITAFMEQVSHLVKLVDSRDITELQLKQLDCELTIRKKEALQPPPVVAMPPSYQHTALPPPPPAATGPPPAPAPQASTPALPAPPKAATSSHPPLKCPMAGTFYRSPAPGEPPFLKVGDKVQKGQVVCIIEAMKLMNEIEADQSGTITEILVEDGKPVSVDTPLFVIIP